MPVLTREQMNEITAKYGSTDLDFVEEFDRDLPPVLQYLIYIGEKDGLYRHPKRKWSELSDEQKMAVCTRNSGKYVGIRKLPSGHTQSIPQYCNLCKNCFAFNANSLKERVAEVVEKTNKYHSDGVWHKATVEKGNEASALKKKISRNQNGRHIALASADEKGKVEVWTLVKDNDTNSDYGEPQTQTPDKTISFDKVYEESRGSKRKLSMGKGFRSDSSSSSSDKDETVQLRVYDIVIADSSRQDEANQIIRDTNYLEIADSVEKVKNLYNWQLKFILLELRKENIAVSFIHEVYIGFKSETLLSDWNNNVKFLMSINPSLVAKNHEAKVDTARLYYPDNEIEYPIDHLQ